MLAVDTSRELVLHLATDAALRRRFLVLNPPLPGNLRFGVLLEALDLLAGDTALNQSPQRTLPDPDCGLDVLL